MATRFSVPAQTSSEDHPASCTMGTGCFLGVKWLGYGVDHPPCSTAEVANGLELYLHLPTVPAQALQGVTLPVLLIISHHYIWIRFTNEDILAKLSNYPTRKLIHCNTHFSNTNKCTI
jgi:hypothetical protein